MMAPKWEKALYAAAVKSPDPTKYKGIADEYPQAKPLAMLLYVLQVAVPEGQDDTAARLLGELWDQGYNPADDAFVQKYVARATTSIEIADGVHVDLPFNRDMIGLVLAEILQDRGEGARAIDVVEQLEPTTITAVSLADLYIVERRWAEVVELTDGLTNEEEATMFLVIQRGIALREQGFHEAARAAFKEALRSKSRPAEMRHRALVERGLTYRAEGKAGMARKEFERVLAENSSYPGLRDLLAADGGA